MTETYKGNKYIMVAIDYLSKYIEIKAIPDKTANNVASFLYEKNNLDTRMS
jgi:hypothetical protein